MTIDVNCNGKARPFRFWCQKILPAVYDDSLSYYELLCKLFHLINEDREAINANFDAIMEIQALLDKWLSGGFNPDIEKAVDEWFDEHGDELGEIINQFIEDNPDVFEESINNYFEDNPDIIGDEIHNYFEDNPDVLGDEINNYFENNPEAVTDVVDDWSKENWQFFTHPGTDSMVLWYSTTTGTIEWNDYFAPFIDHAYEAGGGEVNDKSSSNSYVNVHYFPSTNLMIIDCRIKWKKRNGQTIEDKILNDDRFLRRVPPQLSDDYYDPTDFPYPGGAETPAEAMNQYYWIPLFKFKKPIGWGSTAPQQLGRIANGFVGYPYNTQFYMVTETDPQIERNHVNIGIASKLDMNWKRQVYLYGDGNFVFYCQLASLWLGLAHDTGINMEFQTTLFVPPNGFLSQYQNQTAYDINYNAIDWGRNNTGRFLYGAVGNARLDLIPDKEYPLGSGVMYPQTDCSACMWLCYYYGAGIPIGSAAPGKEMMLGEFVTMAKGGYWDSDTNSYVPGEPLDLSVMKPGDLIGYQTTQYGDLDQIPLEYDRTTGMPKANTVGIVHDNHFPPHILGTRNTYEHMNKYFMNVEDIPFNDFGHVAMYLGENHYLEISGYSVFNKYFPVGHRQAGDNSPLVGRGNIYGNPETYVNAAGETVPFNITLVSSNFDPNLGPYEFIGADCKGKDVIATATSNKANNFIRSYNRYVVRLFPDSVFTGAK